MSGYFGPQVDYSWYEALRAERDALAVRLAAAEEALRQAREYVELLSRGEGEATTLLERIDAALAGEPQR